MRENWWTLLKIHFSSWSNLNDSFREEKEFCQSRKSSIWMKIFGRKSKYLKFLPIRLNFWTNWALRLSGMRVHITLLLQTALHMAIARLPSSVAVVRLLLSRGADWSIKSDDEEAGTAREQIKGIWAAFIQKQFLLSQGGPWGCSKALFLYKEKKAIIVEQILLPGLSRYRPEVIRLDLGPSRPKIWHNGSGPSWWTILAFLGTWSLCLSL